MEMYDVIIVGGGCSGVLVGIEVLRRNGGRVAVAIIDPSKALGRGVAYGTTCAEHLLNVPAGKMSALNDTPSHFVEWLRDETGVAVGPEEFVERGLFGAYLESLLWKTACLQPQCALRWYQERAEGVSADHRAVSVVMSGGKRIKGRVAVLASGYPKPVILPQLCAAGEAYIHEPWAVDWRSQVGAEADVIIIGTGLTAIDQVLALNACGFRGRISLVSRHGMIPGVHAVGVCGWSADWLLRCSGKIRPLLRQVRNDIGDALRQGISWQNVIDSLRAQTPRLWLSLSVAEQKRFLRHVRPYWDSGRHRIPPQAMRVFAELEETGRLRVVAGRVMEFRRRNGIGELALAERNDGLVRAVRADVILNCAGYDNPERLYEMPPLGGLISQGLAKPDPVMLGLHVSEAGGLIDRQGRESTRLFAVGPLCRGMFWETTAVPEIRRQAVVVADRVMELTSRPSDQYMSAAIA